MGRGPFGRRLDEQSAEEMFGGGTHAAGVLDVVGEDELEELLVVAGVERQSATHHLSPGDAAQARRWQISMGGAEPPKFPKITPFRKGPPLPPYKNFPHGGGHGPPSPPSATGLTLPFCPEMGSKEDGETNLVHHHARPPPVHAAAVVVVLQHLHPNICPSPLRPERDR